MECAGDKGKLCHASQSIVFFLGCLLIVRWLLVLAKVLVLAHYKWKYGEEEHVAESELVFGMLLKNIKKQD